MTDRLAALAALVHGHSPLAAPALERFHALFAGDDLVIDKWFQLQARASEPLAGAAAKTVHDGIVQKARCAGSLRINAGTDSATRPDLYLRGQERSERVNLNFLLVVVQLDRIQRQHFGGADDVIGSRVAEHADELQPQFASGRG